MRYEEYGVGFEAISYTCGFIHLSLFYKIRSTSATTLVISNWH